MQLSIKTLIGPLIKHIFMNFYNKLEQKYEYMWYITELRTSFFSCTKSNYVNTVLNRINIQIPVEAANMHLVIGCLFAVTFLCGLYSSFLKNQVPRFITGITS